MESNHLLGENLRNAVAETRPLRSGGANSRHARQWRKMVAWHSCNVAKRRRECKSEASDCLSLRCAHTGVYAAHNDVSPYSSVKIDHGIRTYVIVLQSSFEVERGGDIHSLCCSASLARGAGAARPVGLEDGGSGSLSAPGDLDRLNDDGGDLGGVRSQRGWPGESDMGLISVGRRGCCRWA